MHISLEIPKEYENLFSVNGVLLPGYQVEGSEPEQKKSSVMDQLKESGKDMRKSEYPVSDKKGEPEIG